MNYWLVKSEPSKYSWDELAKDKKTNWDGVRNYAARIHLRAMQINDRVLFYHSNEGVEIVGIAKVVRTSYPDTSSEQEGWVMVDLAAVKKLKKPVTLSQVKADKRLSEMALIKLSRLSVQPVREEEWEIIMSMAGEK